jgi:cytochrome c oxidase subunit I
VSIDIRPTAVPTTASRRGISGSGFLRAFQTTDHKQIGIMYLVTSFAFFLIGGVMALLIRAELGYPGLQF